MPRIPEKVIEEIKSRSEIVDIISEYVSLEVTGNALKGTCPFHDDKGESFTVNRDMQTFKCFACGEGGNVYTFWMRYKDMKFHEVVKFLAEKLGITIPGSTEQDEAESKPDQLAQADTQARRKISVEDQRIIIESDNFTACF